MAIFDPSLIAMARDHGFSSRAATGLTAVVYQWPRQTQTPLLTKASSVVEVRPPAVTEAPLAEFMAARLVKADAPSLEETGDVFLPGSAVSSPAIHIEFENHRSAKLLHAFQWPEAPAEPVSHPAVFRVAVDADGRVRAVVLVSSSGSNEGDEKAAEALRRCTFRATNLTPAPVLSGDAGGGRPPSLDWARAIITWPPPKPSLNVTESSAAEP
jgi:TonB family protein